MNKKQITEVTRALATIGEAFLQLAHSLSESAVPAEEVESVPVPEEEVTVPDLDEELEEEELEEEEIEEVEEDEETEEAVTLKDLDFEDLQLIAKTMRLRGYKNLEHEALVEKIESTNAEKLQSALEELGYVTSEELDTYKEIKETIERDEKIAKGDALPDVPEIEEAEEEDDEEESEIDFDFFDEETLREICKGLGVSTRGKKQALITRIFTVEEEQIIALLEELGLLEDEEEAIEEEPVKKESKKKEAPKRETMTPQRAQVLKDIPDAIDEEIKSGNISYDDIFASLEELGRITEEEDDDDDVLKEKYVQLILDLTDDDGDTHDFEDPYFVNDKLRCCGDEVPVKNDEGTCPHCENHYSLTEE